MLSKWTIAATALLAVAACGESEPFCGDGELNPGEACDDGNDDDTDFCLSTCQARQLSSLTVKWEFNKDEELGFSGDSCIDLGARIVKVELLGGPQPVEALQENCSFRQVVFVDIPAASYTVRLSVLDSEDEMLITSPMVLEYEFPGGVTTTEMIVPADVWTTSYLGTFFFRTTWGGADCALATPEVTEQRLTLLVGGESFTGSTTDGVPLDGSEASDCVSLDEQFPQSALEVPFGPAVLKVEGLDEDGTPVFETEYTTFVGAGVNNPELMFDVELLTP